LQIDYLFNIQISRIHAQGGVFGMLEGLLRSIGADSITMWSQRVQGLLYLDTELPDVQKKDITEVRGCDELLSSLACDKTRRQVFE